MNADPAAKIAMIKGSVRCLVFGLLGLLPLIGIPFAALALVNAGQVRKREKQYWNVARMHWIGGAISAVAGFVISALTVAFFVYNALTRVWQ